MSIFSQKFFRFSPELFMSDNAVKMVGFGKMGYFCELAAIFRRYRNKRFDKSTERNSNMGIQQWSENVILVNLAPEPDLGEEIISVCEMVSRQKEQDVVIDFSDVEIVTSSSIAKLLKLRKAIHDNQRKLVFCCVQPQTKNIFLVTGLDTVFTFVEDQFVALAGLQMAQAAL